ncbi:hypothetical protein PVK06_049008 [Gossypium arboreum]|uniref:Reverse transcriptase n=1 Tax=Gossypium arboreum TaxID=29729 RepID=A0ABR0MK45_GOSAR|nr:hypothetical protein PVK06_049008 [Gossypium arboreum]
MGKDLAHGDSQQLKSRMKVTGSTKAQDNVGQNSGTDLTRMDWDMPTDSYENLMLECSWIGESTNSSLSQHMLKIYNPQIVFFMETKLKVNRMVNVRRRCGFLNGVDVPAEGTREGLSIGWNGDRLITLKNFSKNHIDVEIQEENDKTESSGIGTKLDHFRFEAWRVLEESYGEEIKKLWENSLGSYPNRLLTLAKGLKKWANMIKAKRGCDVKSLTRRLEVLNSAERSDVSLAEIVEVKFHLNMEMKKEERYWEQRARANWLKIGDKNKSFFHKFASQSINQCLLATYSEEEVIEALNGMRPTKASGPDGFPGIFFQKYWNIIEKDTCNFYLGILNDGKSLKEIKKTQLVLIPKIVNPSNLKNFRPISLCTVIYKIIAKTIANRLKKVLDGCIDGSQSAFVSGRLITDNVLLAYQVPHYFKNKRSGRNGFMALKLDMSKASDRVEWPFIKGGPNFNPSRGIRQGDPLSPYLFLFYGEGQSALMRLVNQEKKMVGVKVCQSAPPISHLMFADDCILFGEVSDRGIQVIRDILREYESCSGQCVNFEKSSAFFSSNVTDRDKNLVVEALNVRCSTEAERYLGLPNMVGRRKKEAFQVLKDRLKRKIDSWSTRYLSQGGKKGWRLLRNPNSLLAHTLKAKYFKDSNFLNSRLGNLPSLTWQSIWSAKGLLMKGMGWRIGYGKNVSIWGESKSGSQVADFISDYIKELDGLSSYLPVRRFSTSPWAVPTNPWVKINFGAAFNKDKNESCSGIVVRNARAEVIHAKVVFHKNIPLTFVAGAMVCVQAIQLELHQGLSKVVVEGDSRTVIRKLQKKDEDRSEIKVFINDSKHLNIGFESCDFLFVTREENNVAHILAKEGLQRGETTYLRLLFTTRVEEALSKDQRWSDS